MPPSYDSRMSFGVDETALDARLAEFEQGLFGAGENVAGLLFSEEAAVHHVLRSENDAAEDGLILDDADIAVEVRNVRQAVVEGDEVAEAVAGFELVELHQLVGDGDAVDALAAILEFAHAAEDEAMLLQAEIVGFERARDLDVEGVVEQDGAEHEAFGVYVGRGGLSRARCWQTWRSPRVTSRRRRRSPEFWVRILKPIRSA